VHDLIEGYIRDILRGAIERVERSINNQNIDFSEVRHGLAHQRLQLFFVIDIAGYCQCISTAAIDVCSNLITGVLIATYQSD
jgi:hypothetical protein